MSFCTNFGNKIGGEFELCLACSTKIISESNTENYIYGIDNIRRDTHGILFKLRNANSRQHKVLS